MARGPAKRLLSLYSCKQNYLSGVRNCISTRFLHHSQPSRSQLYSFPFTHVPKKLQLPPPHFTQLTKFGFFLDFHGHSLCTLSETEKPVFESTESIQCEAEPSKVDREDMICNSETETETIVSEDERLNFAKIAERDPLEIYKELKDARKGQKQTRSDWDTLNEIFRCFSRSGWASEPG
ncbi:UNVERIFIED_CONTAM: hypothetical protein Sradi_1213900 [Sesamum radiatum]|uniref:Uncharacterized protein n=1 Tax=Sesamum radiatum TaxID=300843 RepID=A0AAW2ULY5_SESRA